MTARNDFSPLNNVVATKMRCFYMVRKKVNRLAAVVRWFSG